MRVILKRLFFGPGGERFRPGLDGAAIEMPDVLRGKLPRDAKVVDGPAAAQAPRPTLTLKNADEQRANSDALVTKAQEAAAQVKRG